MSKAPGSYYIKTWGCQMNAQDEQKMASLLEEEGYQQATSAAGADVVLLNTCSVREKSSEKLFGFLGRLKHLKNDNPQTVIGVTGCVAQQEGEAIFKRARHVDLVMGPRRIGRLPELLDGLRSHDQAEAEPRGTVVDTNLDDLGAIFWDGGSRKRSGSRAYLTIMEGCNMACTFCIVPRTRGREVHRPLDEIVDEARRRVGEGILELELLGQTVNAFRDGRRAFHHLLESVAVIPGLERLRFTSSHPAFFTGDTAAAMAAHEAICPQLHLPVQSGSDTMLRAMRRGHTIAEYRRRLDDLRTRIPHVAISTDLIIGYPGESDEDFQATMSLIREVRFSQVFAFKYSPRPGTAAAQDATDDIPDQVKSDRLVRLFTLQEEISLEDNQSLVGRTLPVLVDGPSRRDAGVASGRTPGNRVVNLQGTEVSSVTGQIVQAHITAAHRHSLSGEMAR
jgi:tRNA-2-methylthio-N6-dimethylallyladenosine synthase